MDRVGVAQPGLDLGHAQPSRPQATGGRGRGGLTGRGPPAGRSSAAAQPRPDAAGSACPRPARNMSSRASQRAGTAGALSRRRGQDSTTLGAGSRRPRKSCAAWPTTLLGRRQARPVARIGRDSQGPGSAAGGQTRLRQTAQHHHVDGLQPRLQQAPDEDARMLDARRARAAPGGCAPPRLPAPRPAGRAARPAQVGQHRQRGLHFGQAASASASPSSPPTAVRGRAASAVAARRSAASISAASAVRARSRPQLDPQRRLQTGFQPAEQERGARRSPPRHGRGAGRDAQAGEGRGPRRHSAPAPAPPLGKRPGPGPRPPAGASAAPAAAPAPVPRPPREPAGGGTRPAACRPASRRRCRRRPRRSAAAPPPPVPRDPDPASPARPRARRLQRLPQHQRDGLRLSLLVRGRQPGQASSGDRCPVHPVVQAPRPATARGTAGERTRARMVVRRPATARTSSRRRTQSASSRAARPGGATSPAPPRPRPPCPVEPGQHHLPRAAAARPRAAAARRPGCRGGAGDQHRMPAGPPLPRGACASSSATCARPGSSRLFGAASRARLG